MKVKQFFTGLMLLIISLITSSMIVPGNIIPSPQMPLQEFLLKRAFIYIDNATLELNNHHQLSGMEKMVFRKIRKQFRRELQNQRLLDKWDIVEMKDGSKFNAIVTAVKPTEILYKKCDNPEGPTSSIKTASMSYIHFANGSSVDYQNSSNLENNAVESSQQMDPFSIIAFIIGIGSIISLLFLSSISGVFSFVAFFGFLATFILSLLGLRNIKKSNGELKGKGFAIAGLIIGIGGILLMALAILLILLIVVSIP